MKVTHVNFSDNGGGAAIAARRLHAGLRTAGVESSMLVVKRRSDDPHVIPVHINRIELALRRRAMAQEHPHRHGYTQYRGEHWSNARLSLPVARGAAKLAPDLVNLHWVGDGMLSPREMARLRCPLVWTLHDMWAFTGGCHYSEGCTRYTMACGACPQLASGDENDLSRRNFQRKARDLPRLNLTVVTPSQWLAGCVRVSTLLKDVRVEVIPNGLDMQVYRPYDRQQARAALNLPADHRLILFAAMQTDNRRKGMSHLRAALDKLNTPYPVSLLVMGQGGAAGLQGCGFPVIEMGVITDAARQAMLYSAADLFVAPSEEDNLPNTVMEALACGTPCAAFKIGGMPDLIDDQQTGVLVPPFDADRLARAVEWVIADEARIHALGQQARRRAVERYDLPIIAARYLALYREILENHANRLRTRR